jgi:two-component system KDP operon response regulator KdpE
MRRRRHVLFDDGHLLVDAVEGARICDRSGQGLSPTESRLLLYLACNKGSPVTYRELLTNVWGPAFAGEVHYLDTYIDRLRHKLEKDPAHPHYIRTHQEVGFSFADDCTPTID